MDLEIGLLGPLELRRDGTSVNPGGPTQRAVLAMLALHASEPVGVGQLLDGIWGDTDSPDAGVRSLWTHVSRLRAVLDGGTHQPLVRVGGGYRLNARGVSVDAHQFERLLGTARQQAAAGDPASASRTLEEGLALWRGPALMDLSDFPFAAGVAARLEEERIEAAEERIESRLALGEDAALIPELQALIADNPFRERLHGQLMVSLYRAGQQAAALDAYRTARTRLAIDLGVEPGPELEELHRCILEQREVVARRGPVAGAQVPGPPASPRRRPLPAPPALFGRDQQLAELQVLAAETHLITLTGPGGAGKSSLALALLHRLEPTFDGAALVDLGAQASPERVLPAIASALGLSQQGGPVAEQLTAYLADRRMLILLDSAEHALEAVADMAPLVDASRGLIVATSRCPLRLRGEFVVEVPPLAVPAAGATPAEVGAEPSAQLFLHAAAAAGGEVGRSDDEIAAVGEICRAVDGLPLAIQISAAQTRTEGVAELAATLAQRLPTLPSRSLDTPARQHTMDSAIGWSIEGLAPSQRDDLARLSVFSGSFTASAAASVLGQPAPSTLQLLGDLLDASLLMRRPSLAGNARFRMLEPIREVVQARASPDLLAESVARHTAWIRADVDRLCPVDTGIRRPEDLALLRAEHHDLMGALRDLATADPEACIALAHQLGDYWHWTGQEIEAQHVADEVLRGQPLSARASCIALAIIGAGLFVSGRVEDWRPVRDRMVALAGEQSDDALMALVCLSDARFAYAVGDEERGVEVGRAAVTYARRAGEHRVLALSLATLTFLAPHPHGPDALQWLAEAQELASRESMRYTEFWVLAARAIHQECQGNIPESIRLYRAVLDLARRFEAPEAATLPAANLAAELLRTWSIDEARTVLLAALHAADRVGHRIWASVALQELGELGAAEGRWCDALMLLTSSRTLIERMGLTTLYTPLEAVRLVRMERYVRELLGDDRAAGVVARAERMSYREAVDFAAGSIGPTKARGEVSAADSTRFEPAPSRTRIARSSRGPGGRRPARDRRGHTPGAPLAARGSGATAQVPSAAPGSGGRVVSMSSADGGISGAGAPSAR